MNKKQPSPTSRLCLDLGVLGCRIILIAEVEWDIRFWQEIVYISKLFVSKSYLLGVQLNNIIFSQKAYTITWIVLSINYIIICWPLQHNASEESWTHTGLVGSCLSPINSSHQFFESRILDWILFHVCINANSWIKTIHIFLSRAGVLLKILSAYSNFISLPYQVGLKKSFFSNSNSNSH